MLTAQSVFDRVAKHLLAQGEKSMVGNRCVLRDKSGRACAVGCLFGDAYRPEFEGVALSDYMRSSASAALARQGVDPVEHSVLLGHLMDVHDNHQPAAWSRALGYVARYHELDYALT